MKKIFIVVFLFAVTMSNVFGQTTENDWLKKAEEYSDKGDHNNVIKACNEVLKRNNSNLNAYLFRGFSYSQTKNYDAAISDFNYIINELPDYLFAYMVRGDAYGAKGIYHKEIADYRYGFERGYEPKDFTIDKSNKASMWVCGALYKEILINRFLGNSGEVTKYENWLKVVCDKYKITRTEVETFYRENISSLIADAVNEEFNNVSFTLERGSIIPITIYFSLKRNPQNGKYELSYKSVTTQNQTITINGNTFDDLLKEMRTGKNKSDFNQEMINDITTINSIMPAVVYANWKQKGVAGGVDALELITETLTNFYLDPTRANYEKIVGIYAKYLLMSSSENNELFVQSALYSYNSVLRVLNNTIANNVNSDTSSRTQRTNAANVFGSDSRYNVFSTSFDGSK